MKQSSWSSAILLALLAAATASPVQTTPGPVVNRRDDSPSLPSSPQPSSNFNPLKPGEAVGGGNVTFVTDDSWRSNSTSGSRSNSSDASPTTRADFTKVTAAPSGASVLSNAPYTLPTNSLATVCHSAWVPLKTSIWMSTNQVDLEGGDWFTGKVSNWTFSSDTPGIVLGSPSVPSAQDEQGGGRGTLFTVNHRTDPRFLDLTIGNLTDNKIMFQVYNDNGTDINNATWTRNGSTRAPTSISNLGYENVLFKLNVTGYGLCEYPVAEIACRQTSPNLTTDNWKAYHVDEFLNKWNASKKGDYGSNGIFEAFKLDYGINTPQCNVQRPCQMMPTCSAQRTPEGDDAIPAYLAYQAMSNLANFFNTIYDNVLRADVFEANNVPTMVTNFFPNQTADLSKNAGDSSSSSSGPSTKSQVSEGLGMASMIMGLFAVLIAPVFPPAALIAGGLSAVGGIESSAYGIADNQGGKGSSGGTTTVVDSKDFANAAQLSQSLNSLINNLQSNVAVWQTNVLTHGVGLGDMLKDGAFLNPQTAQFSTMETEKAAAWLEKYLTTKLINKAWWLQNVFIAYAPYGAGLTYGDNKKLDAKACNDDFFKKAHDGEIIMCDTDDIFKDYNIGNTGPGMIRLSMYDPSIVKGVCSGNANGTIKLDHTPPGADKTPSFDSADGDFKFNAQDLIRGSMRSWLTGGWGYDYTNELVKKQGGTDANEALMAFTGLADVNQTSAGMYNLPVVQIGNMDAWPDSFSGSNYQRIRNNTYNKQHITDDGILPPQFIQFVNQTDFSGKVDAKNC